MRALITGAGNAGRRLANRLCSDGHDVVLVDRNAQRLDEAAAALDLMTVCGNSASPAILEQAQLSKAQLFAAVTNNDEVNILSALLAHAAGVTYTVVRISNSEYLTPQGIAQLNQLGINLVVNEHEECAREIQMVLSLPGSREVVEMLQGRMWCVGMTLQDGCFLLDQPLQSFANVEVLKRVRLIAVMRQGRLLMPYGELALKTQDIVYGVGSVSDIRRFMNEACKDQNPVQKVVIAGGGDAGVRLAQRLEPTDRQVILIEQDATVAAYCSGVLNKTTVLHGNALERQTLDSIGLTRGSAIVAATGDDENNILASLLAKKAGASHGVAIVSNPSYVEIINDDHLLDRAVSPYLTTINAILRFMRGTNIRAVNLLHDVPGELLEVVLKPGGRWDGKSIKDIKLSKRAVIAALLREADVIVATGDTQLQGNDRLVIFAPAGSTKKVEAVFNK